MKVLLVGSTGMLGQALFEKMIQENLEIITVARSNSMYNLNLLTDADKLTEAIKVERPDVVVNSAAMINLMECENNPDNAYKVNARVVDLVGRACREVNSLFVQISTDHYYINDKKKLHNEEDEIILVNEYARTKYAGECFALTYNNALIIRTNIVGFRNKKNDPTFIEWIINSLQAHKKITGFDDFYTSSIDVETFSDILLELIEKRITGVVNVASADVVSKYEFIYEFAKKLGKEKNVLKGKINQFQEIERATSLGLDTNKLKGILNNKAIPSTKNVLERLINQYEEGAFYEISQ